MNRETAIAHLKHFGANCGTRHRKDGRDVVGIQLRGSRVSNEDLALLKYLADEVDVIGLEETKVTDEGMKYLCGLSILDNIDLANTAISDVGLEVLSSIKTLECLCVEGTKVTESGVKKFEAAVPDCYVTWDKRPV